MLATPETGAPHATATLLYFDPLCESQTPIKPSPRSFKKHKVLPRPRVEVVRGSSPASSDITAGDLTTSNPSTEPATPPRRTQGFRDTGVIGPDPPPTPPAQSRFSFGRHPNLASSTTPVGTPVQGAAAAGAVTPTPGTPTLQKSPPTPDVTPPRVGRHSKGLRPTVADRIPSKGTTDSRTESFKTARESPGESEGDKTTPRLFEFAARTPQTATGRQIESKLRNQKDARLSAKLGLEDTPTPRTKQEFVIFDGEWASNSEVEQEWDDNLDRNVIVRKCRGHPRQDGRTEVMEDVTVTPNNATKALRPVHLHEHKHTTSSPRPLSLESASKGKPRWPASISELSMSTELKRSSGMSTKSTVSTVVEAILVDVPPQRQKTLRHVRKQTALRDSGSEFSPSSSTSNSVRQVNKTRRPIVPASPPVPRTSSMVSEDTVNSIASRKARRQVWKNGGIPVVVIPDRKESLKSASTRPPSLRSRDSRHSKRSNSQGSASRPTRHPAKGLSSSLDGPQRRGRSMSMTYGLLPNDQLTMDYPPIVPRRTSSLSAPTSRNTSRAGSRAGSLTAESLKAHNALLQERIKPQQAMVGPTHPTETTSSQLDQKQQYPTLPAESHKNEISNQRPLVDHNGDPFFGKRLTAYNTPFSQASVETNGTHSAADIAEAMAVNIYSHQNKSVLMVHHVSKPIGNANDGHHENAAWTDSPAVTHKISGTSELSRSHSDGPVTPRQPRFSVDNADSPLRNPRAPPEPPVINFIPATPSGLTSTSERDRMLGNFFEETRNRPSPVRRAFSLRKNVGNTGKSRRSGLLARTFSLSRAMRRNTRESFDPEKNESPILHRSLTTGESPRDESKLHPFWRPTYTRDMDPDDHYSIDDRLAPRRRSLGERMRRTFAILPIEDDDHYTTADHHSPERRTIKRTPSGNLRVVPHRNDLNNMRRSLLLLREGGERPCTAPENSDRRFWGVEKRVDDRGRRLFPGWQEKLEQYRPQNLQRRISEHRRQKRTEALRQKISGPREVRDGVGEIIKRSSYNGPSYQSGPQISPSSRHSPLYDPKI
ncbi:hypothetical protein F4861DRAFT_529998 [Xylaria intraflava]|nr:hypothetical protein F4861DRAFT_529998 [Xylaria intraflava]